MPKRRPEPVDGFTFLSPWLAAKYADGFYIVGCSPKHAKLWRWRFYRVHGESPTEGAFTYWCLDESTADLEPLPEHGLLQSSLAFEDPRVLSHPRDRDAAAVVVLERWRRIESTPMGAAVPT